MKRLFFYICFVFFVHDIAAQNNVGIGTNTPDSSAVLDISSSNKGLLIPRMTSGKRDSIQKLSNGLLLYNTTEQAFQYLKSDTLSSPLITQLGGRIQFNNISGNSFASTLVSLANLQNYFQPLAVQTASTSIDQIKLNISQCSTCDAAPSLNSVIEVYRGVINDGLTDVLVGTLNASIPRSGSGQLITWSSSQSIPITANIHYFFRCYINGSLCSSGGAPNFYPEMQYSSGFTPAQTGFLTSQASLPSSVPNRAVYFEVISNLQTISTSVINSWQTINTSAVQQNFAGALSNGILTSTDWNSFNNKFTLPSLTSGSVLFSNGSNIAQNNSKLFWDNAQEKLSIGSNTFGGTLKVNSSNPGTGTTEWIAGNFGGQANNRVVMGVLNGDATIGAHNNGLNAWAKLVVNPAAETYIGQLTVGSLAGTAQRMVVATANGELATQAVPTGNAGTVTNITASNTIGNPITITNNTSTPVIDIPVATASANGYLSSVDWVRFNNSTTSSGASAISMPNGSVAFGAGSAISGDSSSFFWNASQKQLKISSANDGASSSNWIGLQVGGADSANKDRVVMGLLNSGATIGAHNAGLTNWEKLSINPSGNTNSIVLGGETSFTTPAEITKSPSSGNVEGAHNMPVVVNGSIKQATYYLPFTLDNRAMPGGTFLRVNGYWNHNLGYKPTLMLSFENTSPAEAGYTYSYTHVDNNQIRFSVSLVGGGATIYGGNLHWIVVK